MTPTSGTLPNDCSLNELILQINADQTPRPVCFPSGWGQGRATFGGAVAAVMLKAMAGKVGPSRVVKSMLLTFVGPVRPGEATLETSLLGQGRYWTHVESKIFQAGRVCTVALASFGDLRSSSLAWKAPKRPPVTEPHQLNDLPFVPNVTPVFSKHFLYRWAEGGFPFSGNPKPEMGAWIRFQEPIESISTEWAVALADALPPSVLAMANASIPASSITWSIGFSHDVLGKIPEDFWYLKAATHWVHGGIAQTHSQLWNPEGQLVLQSQQTAAIFD